MKIVSLKDFSIQKEDEDFFIVDDNIAQIIVTLNKKGYKTKFSCESHTKENYIVSTSKKSIEELKCPSCHSYLRYHEEERKIYTRPLYPVLSDFDNPKKVGLQKKENI